MFQANQDTIVSEIIFLRDVLVGIFLPKVIGGKGREGKGKEGEGKEGDGREGEGREGNVTLNIAVENIHHVTD